MNFDRHVWGHIFMFATECLPQLVETCHYFKQIIENHPILCLLRRGITRETCLYALKYNSYECFEYLLDRGLVSQPACHFIGIIHDVCQKPIGKCRCNKQHVQFVDLLINSHSKYITHVLLKNPTYLYYDMPIWSIFKRMQKCQKITELINLSVILQHNADTHYRDISQLDHLGTYEYCSQELKKIHFKDTDMEQFIVKFQINTK
jgi:hypothetical protein